MDRSIVPKEEPELFGCAEAGFTLRAELRTKAELVPTTKKKRKHLEYAVYQQFTASHNLSVMKRRQQATRGRQTWLFVLRPE